MTGCITCKHLKIHKPTDFAAFKLNKRNSFTASCTIDKIYNKHTNSRFTQESIKHWGTNCKLQKEILDKSCESYKPIK